MPKFKDRFSNLIAVMLPIVVSGVFFSQIISTNMEMKNKFQDILGASTAGLTGSASTDGEKIGIISGIIDSIFRLDDNNEAHFNKIKIRGRIDEPDLFNLEKDQSFIWLDQDMDRIFLSKFGVDRIEVVTDEFFNKDLVFKQNLEVRDKSYFLGGMEIDGNLSGASATLSNAYLTEELDVDGNINSDSDITADNLFLRANLSAATGSLTTLATGYFSTPLENNTFNFMSGTIAAGFFSTPFSNKVYSFASGTLAVKDIVAYQVGTSTQKINQGYFVFNSTQDLLVSNDAIVQNQLTVNTLIANESISTALGTFTTIATGYFTSPLSNNTFSFLSGTISSKNIFVDGYFSAGFSSLGATSINGLLTTSTILSPGALTLSSAGTYVYIQSGEAKPVYIEQPGVEVASFDASKINLNAPTDINGNLSAAFGNFSRLGVNGDFSATNGIINGLFSAGNSSLGNATVVGNLALSNPSGYTQLNIFGNGGAFDNQLIGFNIGDTLTAKLAYNSNNALVWTNYSGGTYYNNDSGEGFYWGISENNLVSLESGGLYTKNVIGANVSTFAAKVFSNPGETNVPLVRNGATTYRMGIGAAISDSRLKDNVQNVDNSLSIINQLRPVSYNLKTFQDLDKTVPERHIGLIAQEVEALMPYAVEEAAFIGDTWYKGLDYGRLTAVLIGGVQEQQAQIENLSDAIGTINLNTLQSNYNDFKSALDSLSLSTGAGSLIVNSGLTVTGTSLLNDASFTGNVEVGQVKIDSLENDINIDGTSCVDMDGVLNETNCANNTLNIMKNKAGNIDLFDGKVRFKPNGEVLGEKVQAKTFKNTNTTAPDNSTNCTTGEFKFAEEGGKSYIFYCNSSSNWTRSELSTY